MIHHKDIRKLILIYVIVSGVIVVYAHARCSGVPDVLNFSAHDGKNLDGWSLSHLVLNIVMGYCFPSFRCFFVAMVLGISWELIEYYSSIAKSGTALPFRFLMETLFPLGTTQCKHYKKPNDNWTIYKLSDPLVNAIGYGIGMSMAYVACRQTASIV
jgi:hypothetical protein